MDYYEKKRKAYLIIDEMLRADKTLEEIEFKLSNMFGFGKSIINKRIEQLEELKNVLR